MDHQPRSSDRPSRPLGGVVHTYQKYDPVNFPSPTQEPPDMVSPAFEHMLQYGTMREFTDEELARAIRLDPSQIARLGPSLDALREMLEERKRKILAEYETRRVQEEAQRQYRGFAQRLRPPGPLKKEYQRAVQEEQLYDLERLWYRAERQAPDFAVELLQVVERLGQKYQVEELAAKYEFTGRTPLTVPQALEIKEELETIDRLLKQLEEAAKNAQLAIIDLEELARFAEEADIEQLQQLRREIEDHVRAMAEAQGLDRTPEGRYQLSPKSMRLFQGKLLETIFSQLQAARTGRHQGPIIGEGAVETQRTKSYEFGDSITQMDIPQSLLNAMLRQGPGLPVRMTPDDIVIHRTRNTPKCATCVLMDMSGSMRYGGQYINVKRMALALDGLIRREFPGDYLQFLEMFTFAKARPASEIVRLMPKPVTLFDPVVRLRADMSNPELTEGQIPPHFTNIQHALQLSRRFLAAQDTPNRQIILITDGLPTAHFEGSMLYLRYPPDQRTEQATMREGLLCKREGITINIFLLPSWSQSSEDIQFAHQLAQSTTGRVFFTAGKDLDRYVVWDYVQRKRQIIG